MIAFLPRPDRFLPLLATATLAASVLVVPSRAWADACDDSCDSDAPPCSVEERCPESGVECYGDFEGEEYDACVAKAEAAGLELRCTENSDVYCDPDEEVYVEDEGCAMKSPKRPAGGVGLAAITFAAAATAMLVRARRRTSR